MAQYQILYYCHIPLGVKAIDPNGIVRENLPPRFMEATERLPRDWVAMLRWGTPQEREGSAEEVVKAIVAEIDTQWPDEIPLEPPE